jgi:hypothetical protein
MNSLIAWTRLTRVVSALESGDTLHAALLLREYHAECRSDTGAFAKGDFRVNCIAYADRLLTRGDVMSATRMVETAREMYENTSSTD